MEKASGKRNDDHIVCSTGGDVLSNDVELQKGWDRSSFVSERRRLFRLKLEELLDKPDSQWTDEDLFFHCPEFRDGKIDVEDGLKEIQKLRKYYRELRQSGGFDITVNPRIGLPRGRIYPFKFKTKRGQKYVKGLAQSAIEFYNDNNKDYPVKTNFQVVQVEKVTMSCDFCAIYYLTFTAKDESPGKRYRTPKTFQARVVTSGRPNEGEPHVELCRLKPKDECLIR